MRELFINSFHFNEISYREQAIATPYGKTFQWMFKDSPERKSVGFAPWLESESSLFWITGKLGSGKSTLMKYLANFESGSDGARLCRSHLQKWAKRRRLILAKFYFWAAGSTVEASEKGLLQSLLYQLLRQCPDVIPRIAPSVWEGAYYFGTSPAASWPLEELHVLLFCAVKEICSRQHASVCLFVDGLDEFEGDLTTLINTFRRIQTIPNLKLCVSSRPWLVFEDAFSQNPNLRLQDLTYPDIKFFVQ